jgi:hypothetical protein
MYTLKRCECCGAPLSTSKCDYCGTNYNIEKNRIILNSDNTITFKDKITVSSSSVDHYPVSSNTRLGTPLRIFSGGSEIASINDSGTVFIGTTTPKHNLYIQKGGE